MNRPRNRHPDFHFGILFHGSKVWISELSSMIFVSALVTGLSVITLLILRNELKIQAGMRVISHLQSSAINLEHQHSILKKKQRLFAAARAFLGNRISPALMHRVTELVHANSAAYGYDPLLVLAVINVESYFDPRALGRYRNGRLSGAFGLMQLKLKTAREVAAQLNMKITSRDDLFKPEINLVLGVAYLTRLISEFRSLKLGILAYNQGPGTIRRTLSEKRPLSIRYYRKVLRSYYRLKALIDE